MYFTAKVYCCRDAVAKLLDVGSLRSCPEPTLTHIRVCCVCCATVLHRFEKKMTSGYSSLSPAQAGLIFLLTFVNFGSLCGTCDFAI